MTELADLKMPGALEAVDGVLAQVDSAAVTAGEAIELVLNSPDRAAQQRSVVVAGPHAGVPSIDVAWLFGGPRRASGDVGAGENERVGPASSYLAALSAARGSAHSAPRFFPTRPPGGEGGRVEAGRTGQGFRSPPAVRPLARVSGGRCRGAGGPSRRGGLARPLARAALVAPHGAPLQRVCKALIISMLTKFSALLPLVASPFLNRNLLGHRSRARTDRHRVVLAPPRAERNSTPAVPAPRWYDDLVFETFDQDKDGEPSRFGAVRRRT